MEKDSCQNCRHFRQHYVSDGKRYDPAYCGHCVYPRVKTRKPDTPACIHFVQCGKSAVKERQE